MSEGAPAGSRFGPRVTAAIYALLTVTVLVPVFSVQVPALGDYLNHLARVHVLANVGHSPALQQFYETRWRLVPYFGFDIPVLALSQFMGLVAAGRLFVAVCVVMPVVAAACLHYAAWGRVGLVPALGFLLSYGFMLQNGFLNYLFMACLAVMLFAAWIASQEWERWRRAALFGLAALVLYLGHTFAFLAYGLLVAGFELARLVRRDGGTVAARLMDGCAAASQALPTVAFAALLQARIIFPNTTGNFIYKPALEQATGLLMPLYFPGPDWLTYAFFILPFVALGFAPWLRWAPAAWPSLLLMALVACAVPRALFNVYGADFRLPLVVAIVAIGAVAPSRKLHRGVAAGAFVVLAGLVVARSADAFTLLRRLAPQVADVRRVLAQMPVGQRLLVVEGDEHAAGRVAAKPMTGHLGLLATLDRDAFVPYFFTGVTAIQVKPAMLKSASMNSAPVTFAQLEQGFRERTPPDPLPPFGDGGQQYWLGWPEKFDYVLIDHFGARHGGLPACLRPVATSSVADLFKVVCAGTPALSVPAH